MPKPRYDRNETRVSRDLDHREDGGGYTTPIVQTRTCPQCGYQFGQRAEGRRRVYCSRTCRTRGNRATPKLPGL